MGEQGVSVEEGVTVSDDFSLDVGKEHGCDGDEVSTGCEDGFEFCISWVREVNFNAGEEFRTWEVGVMEVWIFHLLTGDCIV